MVVFAGMNKIQIVCFGTRNTLWFFFGASIFFSEGEGCIENSFLLENKCSVHWTTWLELLVVRYTSVLSWSWSTWSHRLTVARLVYLFKLVWCWLNFKMNPYLAWLCQLIFCHGELFHQTYTFFSPDTSFLRFRILLCCYSCK